jgi:hypothetical protein
MYFNHFHILLLKPTDLQAETAITMKTDSYSYTLLLCIDFTRTLLIGEGNFNLLH